MRAFATPARIATLLAVLALALAAPAAAAPAPAPAPGKPAAAKPFERRMHPTAVEASSFLWNDSNKFVENCHPSYVADDDPSTAWIEGAKSSGAGEWLRITTSVTLGTTQVRLRVRNGYQRSKDLWKANARAKEVTVLLLPDRIKQQVTLTDTDGWQEIVVDQPRGELHEVALSIGSVYEGARSTDLGISDIQVFVTSDHHDDPQRQKASFATWTSWKTKRLAAAKQFAAKPGEQPLYPAYEVQQVGQPLPYPPILDGVAAALKDPGFAKEWKDALAVATALQQDLGSMTRAQLAPTSQTRLVEVHGTQIAGVYDWFTRDGVYPQDDAIRLPMLGLVSAMFADQLRVVGLKTGQTIEQYKKAPKGCGADAVWMSRTQPKEGPSRVVAIAVGKCRRLIGRGGAEIGPLPYVATAIELMIYDPTGKLVLVSGPGYLEGYRWTMEGGKPMLAGGRSMIVDGSIREARRPTMASTP